MSIIDDENIFPIGDYSQLDFYKTKCLKIRENDIVVLQDRPYKVVETRTTPITKKTIARKYLVGIDIFTGEKYSDVFSVTDEMIVPNMFKKEYQLLDLSDDGFASLLDQDSNTTREDVKLPTNEIGKQIKEKLNSDETIKVTVVKCLGEEQIVSYKLESN